MVGIRGAACGAQNGPSALGTCASLPGPPDAASHPRRLLLSPPATRTARPGASRRPPRTPCPALGGSFNASALPASLSLDHRGTSRGKAGVGTGTAVPGLVCFFPSCQLLFGAQIMYSSKLNINGFTLPLSFRASMLRSTENSPVSHQEKSWVISSRGAGGSVGIRARLPPYLPA